MGPSSALDGISRPLRDAGTDSALRHEATTWPLSRVLHLKRTSVPRWGSTSSRSAAQCSREGDVALAYGATSDPPAAVSAGRRARTPTRGVGGSSTHVTTRFAEMAR